MVESCLEHISKQFLVETTLILVSGTARVGCGVFGVPPGTPLGKGGGVLRVRGVLTFLKSALEQKKSRLRRKKTSFLAFSERLAALCTKKFAPAARIFYFSDFLSQLTRSWDPPGKGGD